MNPICRRCGERDKRGSSWQRRQRRKRLLEIHGNGVIAACVWCGILVGNTGHPKATGYLTIPAHGDVPAMRLRIVYMEQDRISRFGWYSLYNLVPSCGPCNRGRTYLNVEIREGCEFGPTDLPATA